MKLLHRGFSLLEVLMAAALFGAVVTTILAAEAGLVGSNAAAAKMSQAITVARCRMSEIAEKQLKLGFPEIEEKDTSNNCCDDKEVTGFTCAWQVERVTLPSPNIAADGGATSFLGGGLGLDGGLDAVAPLGSASGSVPPGIPPGFINPAGGATLDLDAGLQGIGQSLQGAFGGVGGPGLLSMAFSIVYPALKPMLESAIRRVTVKVSWKEGLVDRDFTLVQYITNPSRAGLLAGMADAGTVGGDGGGGMLGGLLNGLGGMGGLGGGTSPLGGGH
jgi:prepilin-type N-terminal cleavage/methylation domain-containing protein